MYARVDLVDDKIEQEAVLNDTTIYNVHENDEVTHHLHG